MTVSAVGNFCITVTNETATPTGGITCSALGGAVNRHLLRLRLTSARSSRRLSTRGSTVASVQISQGNSRDLPAYACRIYVTAFRASIGLWRFVPPHPAVPPLSASCSSGQHFASGFLQIRGHPRHPCLRLTLPLAGCVEDFHLQVTHLATTTKRVALTRNAPCLAHTKKPRGLPRGFLSQQWPITAPCRSQACSRPACLPHHRIQRWRRSPAVYPVAALQRCSSTLSGWPLPNRSAWCRSSARFP